MGDLSEYPAPATRRRHRWLIAAAILVVVTLVSWQCWPRADARFVGKWKVDEIQGPRNAFTLWTFHPNGILENQIVTGAVQKMTWKIDGDVLVTGPQWNSGPFDRFLPVSDWWGRLTDPIRAASERSRIDIDDISTTELDLSYQSYGGARKTLKLERLPE